MEAPSTATERGADARLLSKLGIDQSGMPLLDEDRFIAGYTNLTGAAESQARSVYILLDAVPIKTFLNQLN
jgi:hypothetical protein